MRRRPAVTLLAVALLAAGCGEKEEPAGGGSGAAGGGGDGRSLSGCLELWEGPHLGSTRVSYVAKTQTVYAKVAVAGGRCQVEYATRDYKIYGRFIEKENPTGPWSLDADKGSRDQAKRVVETANATATSDGGLDAGAP